MIQQQITAWTCLETSNTKKMVQQQIAVRNKYFKSVFILSTFNNNNNKMINE